MKHLYLGKLCQKPILYFFLLVISFFQTNHSIAQTGRSLHFDGNLLNRVDLPFVFNGSYTKEAWIKPEAASLNNFPNIISGDATALYINFGLLSAGHGGSGFNNVQDNVPLIAGQWYHVAVTYNAATNEMKLYKNGVEVSSVNNAPTYTETLQHLSYFAGGNHFFGEMDEVRLWKSVRSATEISNYKNCELTGDEPQLLAYYNFNQGTAGGTNDTELFLLDRTDRCGLAYNALLWNFLLTGNTSNWVSPGAPLNNSCTFNFSNINITGNSLCIVNGDNTPSLDDFTSFGPYSNVPVTRTFTIQNTGSATLNVGSIQITGTNASDFSVTANPASSVAGNSSTNFTISFNATGAEGLKSATVTVNSDDADELTYSFAIEGSKAGDAKSLDFDGVDDHIDLPFILNGSYTKEVWLKNFNQFGFPNVLTGTGTAFFLNNGRMAAGHAPDFTQIIDPNTTPLEVNTWYHFAVTYDAATSEMKLFRNGVLVATTPNVPNYTETTQKIGIFNNANFFFGRLDQVRFWDRARTNAEILNSYNCKISGDEPGLIAWYNFSNGKDAANNMGITTLIDEADKCNPNNGILQNFNLDGPSSNWVSDSILTNNNCVASFPNIQLSGNNICILNGDNSPQNSDNTDFGIASQIGVSKIFTITNTGTATLNIGNINFSGNDNSMFTLSNAPSATLSPGTTSNFTVLFTPVGVGLKTATISILSNDTDESPYTFAIQGTGTNDAFVIRNIVATVNVNGTSTITWNTDVAATSRIDYGTNPLNLNLTQGSAALVTNHSVQLSGLNLGVTYFYRVTSVDGSSNSITNPAAPAAPLSFSMPPFITAQPVSVTVCSGATVNLSSTAESDVAFSVQWQISTNNGSSWQDSIGATNANISFVASAQDNGKQFRALWTNAGGTNISNAATISVNPTTSSTTNVTVCSTALPYAFNGNNYSTAGTYSVTLAGANEFGCDSIATLNLTVTNFTLVISNTPLACLGDNNGTFTVTASNGLAPFEYSINSGVNWFPTGTFNNLSAGNYTLSVRDASGCTKDTTVTIAIEKATWTGAVSSDWHNTANWNNNRVPTANTHVIISNTSTNECIISNSNAVAASIQTQTGVVVKVENGRTILIAGNCTNLPAN